MKAALGFVAAPVVLLLLLVVFIVVIAAKPAAADCADHAGTVGDAIDIASVPAGPIAGYGRDQLVNAAHIINAGIDLGLPVRGQQIGVMTAMGESSLVVLNHGDAAGPDSVGLFQQRGNGAWGTYQDRMDPRISATNFFTALLNVDGWEQLAPSRAAHAVQGNQDPDHYTKFWTPAGTVMAALTGTSAGGSDGSGDGAVTGTGDTAGGGVGGCVTGDVALPLDRPFIITSHFGARPAPTAGASSNHPATDMVGHCGDPVYAVVGGTVTKSDRLWLSVKADAGYTVSYLHMHAWDRVVHVGDQVTAGEVLGKVGDESPATGCHLDLRINTDGNSDNTVAALPTDPTLPGWVDPEDFMAAFGQPLTEAAA